MRKLLLPLLLVLLALPVWAQASALTFSTQRGEPFQMYLNGRLVNVTATNMVRVANLQPGRHFAEFKIRGRYGIYSTGVRVMLVTGFESNYRLHVSNRGRIRVQNLGNFPLTPPVATPEPPVSRYPDNAHGDYSAPQLPDLSNSNNRESNCQNTITRYDLDKLIETIKARSSESTKLTIAREAVRANRILAEDLKELLEQFEFESTRVEFAKFAYDTVCDKERFYYIYDAFEFDTSIQELNRYTSGKR